LEWRCRRGGEDDDDDDADDDDDGDDGDEDDGDDDSHDDHDDGACMVMLTAIYSVCPRGHAIAGRCTCVFQTSLLQSRSVWQRQQPESRMRLRPHVHQRSDQSNTRNNNRPVCCADNDMVV
jgi:hypothetical protein